MKWAVVVKEWAYGVLGGQRVGLTGYQGDIGLEGPLKAQRVGPTGSQGVKRWDKRVPRDGPTGSQGVKG